MHRKIVGLFLSVSVVSAFAAWTSPIAGDIWQLSPTPTGSRWLVIHNLASAETDGVYHIEVLERDRGAAAWEIKHIAKHMAISSTALRASIIKPLKNGDVYPETFESAYTEWLKEKALGKAFVCESDVTACLKHDQ